MLKHTEETVNLIKKGLKQEAIDRHNARVKAEFDEAKNGKVICLTDIMAAKEQIILNN